MNYLAHAYLSFGHQQVLVGNMISDYIKGRRQYDYPPEVLVGIKLHRAIDAFTDAHAITKELKTIFVPNYRLYAGAFVDVVYDYFLANDTTVFAEENDLLAFTALIYQGMDKEQHHFPEKFAKMFPYMRTQNWLYHYKFDDGMQKSFNGLMRRSAYITETELAYALFLKHKNEMQGPANLFLKDVKLFAENELNKQLKQ